MRIALFALLSLTCFGGALQAQSDQKQVTVLAECTGAFSGTLLYQIYLDLVIYQDAAEEGNKVAEGMMANQMTALALMKTYVPKLRTAFAGDKTGLGYVEQIDGVRVALEQQKEALQVYLRGQKAADLKTLQAKRKNARKLILALLSIEAADAIP